MGCAGCYKTFCMSCFPENIHRTSRGEVVVPLNPCLNEISSYIIYQELSTVVKWVDNSVIIANPIFSLWCWLFYKICSSLLSPCPGLLMTNGSIQWDYRPDTRSCDLSMIGIYLLLILTIPSHQCSWVSERVIFDQSVSMAERLAC